MSFKFQVISDIHLEMRKNIIPKIKSKCDTLFMAGDIGNYNESNFERFLDYVSKNFKQSFYITGNHEYYNHIKEMADEKYKQILDKYDNITYLDKDVGVVNIGDVDIVGCTLWSSPIETRGLNDFKRIKVKRYNGSVNSMNIDNIKKYNKDDIVFLRNVIDNKSSDRKLIVMTHFMPILTKDLEKSKYPSSVYDYYYGNEVLMDYVKKCDVWIFGHTHDCCDQKVGDCQLLANACGYPNEETDFENKVFTVA